MTEASPAKKGAAKRVPRWALRWGLAVLLLAGFAWLAVWLTERTYKSANKRRNLQSWLEDSLNTDVSILDGMVVRLNLVRPSRLELRKVEVDHPNAIFPGKFVTLDRVGVWPPPWSVFHLWDSRLDIAAEGMVVNIEENESGEWNTAGLMNPLAAADSAFPFPIPKFTRWRATLSGTELVFSRPDGELRFDMDAEITGAVGGDEVTLRARNVAFNYVLDEGEAGRSGGIDAFTLTARLGRRAGGSPSIVPVHCEARIRDLPISMLPFLFGRIPLERTPGLFTGQLALKETAAGSGSHQLTIAGEIRDAPLSLFGLPGTAAVRVDWPFGRAAADGEARMHFGPSGFGGFDMSIPLDSQGKPRLLAMRGDVAALDDLPSLLTRHSRWLDWLSLTFPAVEWHSGKWLGFGWSGNDMQLALTRTGAGLNLSGEAELLQGKVRLAMTPGQGPGQITLAAEKMDAQLLAVKLSQTLPEWYRVPLTGQGASFTWRGTYADEGGERNGGWSLALVFAKPVIDPKGGGEWWRRLLDVPVAIADALPGWGGGDPEPLRRFGAGGPLALEQLSVVTERAPSGAKRVEFVTFGERLGEAGGWFEDRPGKPVAGEIYFTGDSALLSAVEKANRIFGLTLRLLAKRSLGLRLTFAVDPEKGPEFKLPFLDDAKSLGMELEQRAARAEGGEP